MLSEEDKERILALRKDYSIYSPFSDADLFHRIIDELGKPFESTPINKVVGIEARGFILGGTLAYILNIGFVVIRKGGSMYKSYYSSTDVFKEELVDYSGQRKTLEIQNEKQIIGEGDRVLLVDDWFETGNQGKAAIRLIEKTGAQVAGIAIMLDNMTPHIRSYFKNYNLHALVLDQHK